MKSRSSKFGAVVACVVLCEPVLEDSIGKNFDVVRGCFEDGSTPATVTVALNWGEHTTLRNIETQTMFIRHTATEVQRRIAERNKKVFFQKYLTPDKKAELKKKHIKTVLIPTVPDPPTPPRRSDFRMRYSLEGESLIDDYAYEFPTPLQAGTIAQVKGLEPEYVGQ